MPSKTMQEAFNIPAYPKPRSLRQTWLKDVGYDEAPKYIERMGLVELEDFLEVAAERLDYVKIVTTQIIFSPHEWLKRKIAAYQRFAVKPYLDHSFFMQAYQRGVVESAIVAGRELGFRVIEFMNTTDEVSAAQWKAWRKLALDLARQPGAVFQRVWRERQCRQCHAQPSDVRRRDASAVFARKAPVENRTGRFPNG